VHLKEFSFISPVIESAEVFSAIETAIPPDAIAEAVGKTDSMEERQRKLPSQLVVCLVIAMCLWSSDSIAFSSKEAGEWFEYAVDSTGAVLASAKQFIN